MCSLIFWRYEKFARSPKKLLDKQVVVRLENNEENARYAVLGIMLVMRVFFARYLVNRGVVNRGRSVYIYIYHRKVTLSLNNFLKQYDLLLKKQV